MYIEYQPAPADRNTQQTSVAANKDPVRDPPCESVGLREVKHVFSRKK